MAKEKKEGVAFSPEQMAAIQGMLDNQRESSNSRRPDAVSMYNLRDPKKIESVNVMRVNGKFFMGYKNFQKDAFKNKPRYYQLKRDDMRGLLQEPFVTLRLQENEDSEIEELEMSLNDFVMQGKRDRYQAKVLEVKEKEVIEDHGILGAQGEYAGEVDDKGKPVTTTKVLAQTKRLERVFMVELPGFSKPVEFISDFLS